TSGDFVKVLDFGLVHDVDAKHSVRVVAGTPGFMAPEVLAGHAADARADIYSLGCVARWLLGTANPIPADLEAVVTACVEKDPQGRPQTAHELAAGLAACAVQPPWTSSDARRWWDL